VDVVVDDHVLLNVLAGIASPALREELGDGVVFTTGCWYYRLSRAVNAGSGTGSLSGQLAELEPSRRDRPLAVALVIDGAIRVRVSSALLGDGARDLEVDYRVLA
jgi:hypothetical protein